MTFEDVVTLVDELSTKLAKLAYLKDELAILPDKSLHRQAVDVSVEIDGLLEELDLSGIRKIRDELVRD